MKGPRGLSRLRTPTAVAPAGLLATLAVLAMATPQGIDGGGEEALPGEPPATLVWPVGLDGHQPRVLYDTQGQWVQRKDWTYLHSGIDIGASPEELVFAVEDGTVVALAFGEEAGEDGGHLIVSRGEDPAHGIKYMHMDSSTVDLGATVRRDELLGTITDWDDAPGFEHLHLQVVHDTTTEWDHVSPWTSGYAKDDGNPLLLMKARSDDAPPTLELQTTKDGESVTLLLLDDEAGEEVAPHEIAGPVDVVARVSERFPGSEPGLPIEEESPEAHPLGGEPPEDGAVIVPADVLAPLRLELRVSVLGPAQPERPAEEQRAYGTLEYAHTIDFSGPIPASGEGISLNIYQDGSVGTYTERDLRFVVTHDMVSGVGAWNPSASGPYRVELVVTDASHNVTSYSMDVTVALP